MMIPSVQPSPLTAALQQLGPHDHLCSIYETQQEHYSVAIPFVRIGLDRGEKCIYIADDGKDQMVREAMHAEGIDVEHAIADKSLILTAKGQTYLKSGSFDPDCVLSFWKEATQSALSEGFSALRATGETEWLAGGHPAPERWIECESRVADTLTQNNCFALCQYDRRILKPEIILDLIRMHPIVVYRGTVCRNLYYVPPDDFLGNNRATREVERMLTNILERERLDSTLRDQKKELQRAREILAKDIAQRRDTDFELLALKDELAAKRAAMPRLHRFSTRLLANTEVQPLLEEVLSATMELQNADFGNVQLYNPQTQALEIVA